MANKLPEVGKRYKTKANGDNKESICEVKLMNDWQIVVLDEKYGFQIYYTKAFDIYCEELPEENLVSAKNAQTEITENTNNTYCKKDMENEIEKAKEELREKIFGIEESVKWFLEHIDLIKRSNPHNLENRYETLLMLCDDFSKILISGKNQEETKKEEKPQSIWKPVSELPEESANILLKWDDGEILYAEYLAKRGKIQLKFDELGWEFEKNDSRFKKFCTLTNFINDIEQTKLDHEERLRKLEGINIK